MILAWLCLALLNDVSLAQPAHGVPFDARELALEVRGFLARFEIDTQGQPRASWSDREATGACGELGRIRQGVVGLRVLAHEEIKFLPRTTEELAHVLRRLSSARESVEQFEEVCQDHPEGEGLAFGRPSPELTRVMLRLATLLEEAQDQHLLLSHDLKRTAVIDAREAMARLQDVASFGSMPAAEPTPLTTGLKNCYLLGQGARATNVVADLAVRTPECAASVLTQRRAVNVLFHAACDVGAAAPVLGRLSAPQVAESSLRGTAIVVAAKACLKDK